VLEEAGHGRDTYSLPSARQDPLVVDIVEDERAGGRLPAVRKAAEVGGWGRSLDIRSRHRSENRGKHRDGLDNRSRRGSGRCHEGEEGDGEGEDHRGGAFFGVGEMEKLWVVDGRKREVLETRAFYTREMDAEDLGFRDGTVCPKGAWSPGVAGHEAHRRQGS
jgi:hypothetical protein